MYVNMESNVWRANITGLCKRSTHFLMLWEEAHLPALAFAAVVASVALLSARQLQQGCVRNRTNQLR